MKVTRFKHQFVEYIPEQLLEGVLYISMENAVAVHSCACGCGNEVVTPISPTDWRLKFDGVSISLEPSIGNWAFACRSHYFIRNDVVRWAGNMSKEAIQYGKDRDKFAKELYYANADIVTNTSVHAIQDKRLIEPNKNVETSWIDRVKKWLS